MWTVTASQNTISTHLCNVDSCFSRNWKVTLNHGLFFHKVLTAGRVPGPDEKRRIVRESTPDSRVTFLESDSAPVSKIFESGSRSGHFWSLRIRLLFRIRLTIDPSAIFPRFYLRKDHADSCYCRNLKVTLDPVSGEISDLRNFWLHTM